MQMGSGHASVAVIGGGIAGLAAGWGVNRAGRSVIVFEADTRVGGVISSERHDGYLAEMGPTSAMMTPELSRLLMSLGMRLQRVDPSPTARRRFVARDGRPVAVSASPPSMLATPLLSIGGKARALADLFLPRASEAAPEESVASLARRRFGREAADYLIDPMITGIYAGDPERLSSRHTVRALHDLEQRHGSVLRGAISMARARRRDSDAGHPAPRQSMFSFHGGLRELPDAIAASLGSSVRLHTVVRSLTPDGSRWRVEFEGPEGVRRSVVDSVVATVPAHALAAIDMPASLRAAIAPVACVPDAAVATVALGFRREDVAHPLDGFGVLIPYLERSGILGVLFSSSIFQSRAPAGSVLITCMIGGSRNAPAAYENDHELEERALDAVGPLLGISAKPTFVIARRWPHAIPQYELGHDEVITAAARAEAHFPGLFLAGSYRDGVSIADRVASGMRTGARAAARGTIGGEERRLG